MATAQTTPAVEILESYFNGKVVTMKMPFNEHYCILEGKTLPAQLGYPLNWPRTYAVVNVPKSGAHAHRPGTEKEIMVCLAGQATVYLWTKKGENIAIVLSPAGKGEKFKAVFVSDGIWHTVRYAPGAVLLVAASKEYDRENDYDESPEKYFNPEGLEKYFEVFNLLG